MPNDTNYQKNNYQINNNNINNIKKQQKNMYKNKSKKELDKNALERADF